MKDVFHSKLTSLAPILFYIYTNLIVMGLAEYIELNLFKQTELSEDLSGRAVFFTDDDSVTIFFY